VKHRIGLRQGDPLSPILFILAMEPLQKMLLKAEGKNLLTQLQHKASRPRVSLFADDAAIFINPVMEKVQKLQEILFSKKYKHREEFSICIYPIWCEGIQTTRSNGGFPMPNKIIPMHLSQAASALQADQLDIQALIDKVASRIPIWKGKAHE